MKTIYQINPLYLIDCFHVFFALFFCRKLVDGICAFLRPHHHYLLESFLARFKTVLSYKVGLFFDL